VCLGLMDYPLSWLRSGKGRTSATSPICVLAVLHCDQTLPLLPHYLSLQASYAPLACVEHPPECPALYLHLYHVLFTTHGEKESASEATGELSVIWNIITSQETQRTHPMFEGFRVIFVDSRMSKYGKTRLTQLSTRVSGVAALPGINISP